MILNHDFVKYIFTETMTILYFLLKLFINEVKKNSTLSQIFKPEKIHYIFKQIHYLLKMATAPLVE